MPPIPNQSKSPVRGGTSAPASPPAVEQPPGTGAAPSPAGAPGADSPTGPGMSQDSGMQVAYFAFKIGGEEGKPVGLFRIADDADAKVLTMERFSPDGEWVDDPALIDDLHEPGVYSVDEDEAQSIQQAILGSVDPAAAPGA